MFQLIVGCLHLSCALVCVCVGGAMIQRKIHWEITTQSIILTHRYESQLC